jgi:AraC-like DNA-binding protein
MKSYFIDLHDTVLILTAAESFLLCILLSILSINSTQLRILLILFFSLTGCIILSTFVIWNPFLQTLPLTSGIFCTSLLAASTLLQGPVLYFYFRSLSEKINLLRWINFLHLVPAIVTTIVIVTFEVNTFTWLPWNRALLDPVTKAAFKFSLAVLRYQPIMYAVACIYAEYHFRQQVKAAASDNRVGEKLILADIVLGGFLLREIWAIIGYHLGGHLSVEANNWIGMIGDYLSTLLVNAMFIYGITNTRKILIKNIVKEHKAPENFAEIAAEKIFAIEKGIREEKLYLERNLNLERFASRIGLKSREVTVILNTHYKSNFFEFINSHRIKEAKRLLSSCESKDKIMDIIQKSGFNSESTFSRYFKQATGLTPSEYREQKLKKTHNKV